MSIKFEIKSIELLLFETFAQFLARIEKPEANRTVYEKALEDEGYRTSNRYVFYCYVGQELFGGNISTRTVENFFKGSQIADDRIQLFCKKFSSVYSNLTNEEKEQHKGIKAAFIEWKKNIYQKQGWKDIDENNDAIPENTDSSADVFSETLEEINRLYEEGGRNEVTEYERKCFENWRNAVEYRTSGAINNLQDYVRYYLENSYWRLYRYQSSEKIVVKDAIIFKELINVDGETYFFNLRLNSVNKLDDEILSGIGIYDKVEGTVTLEGDIPLTDRGRAIFKFGSKSFPDLSIGILSYYCWARQVVVSEYVVIERMLTNEQMYTTYMNMDDAIFYNSTIIHEFLRSTQWQELSHPDLKYVHNTTSLTTWMEDNQSNQK